MALSDQEKQIVEFGKANNKSLVETKAAIANFRKTQARTETLPDSNQQDGVFRGTGEVLSSIFGGKKIGQAIGRGIARGTFGETVQKAVVGRDLSPEEEALVAKGPTGKEIAGDVARVGSTFIPVGRIAGGLAKAGRFFGLGKKAAEVTGAVGAGAGAGAAIDVTEDIAAGRDVELGAETAIGAGIPAASPVFGALRRVIARVTGKVGSEISGALTGTSAETLEEAFASAKAGGKQLETFTDSLRGKTTPEQLTLSLKNNIEQVNATRQTLFRETLQELGDEVVETAGAKTGFNKFLDDAKIVVAEDGTLDFANAGKLKLVPQAQNKIKQAYEEVLSLPETATLEQVDDARQAIKALRLTGDDPSANLGNKLIDDAVRSVRGAGEQIQGYKEMLGEFAETSEFLDEISRGLSAGDRATIDQTYRRMATSLKTNNEQRLSLVRELDQATDGAILSGISGQQLSEVLPRGIFRQISAGIAGGSVLTGSFSPALLPTLLLASPRVMGEFVRALGIGAKKADLIITALNEAQGVITKAGILLAPEEED